MKEKKASARTAKTARKTASKSSKHAKKIPTAAKKGAPEKWTATQFVKKLESCRPSTATGYFTNISGFTSL